MKLIVNRQKAGQPIVGSQAVILRDDIQGGSIAIQSGDNLVIIKLSDLINVVNAQENEKPETDDVNG